MRLLPVALGSAVLVAAAAAQTSAPSTPPSASTIGFMHAIHATERLETTLGLYTDVFGLSAEIRPFANPAVAILTDSPGAALRIAMLPLEDLNLELTEFSNVPRTAAAPSVVDPGAPRMKILVRDLAPVLAALDGRNSPIVTRSHAPVRVPGEDGAARAILFRDPDGYLVEAVEVQSGAAGNGNVQGATLGLTVADLDESLRFWRDRLGFAFDAPTSFTSDPERLDLYGLKGNMAFRTVTAGIPGSAVRLELIEFRDVPRRPFDLRVPDPGASGLAIRVADIAALLDELKASGTRVISKDRALVEWNATLRNVFVKDPNGFNVELVGQAAPAR
jgi:catechol 2,3-dioxygenase-like lactoylglutathione lyase family enzyme